MGQLEQLNLDQNEIADWSELNKLAGLENLFKLTVNSNLLAAVFLPAAGDGGLPLPSLPTLIHFVGPRCCCAAASSRSLTPSIPPFLPRWCSSFSPPPLPSSPGPKPFAALRSLSLCDNKITLGEAGPGAGWGAVVALDGLPALVELRCIGNPIVAATAAAASAAAGSPILGPGMPSHSAPLTIILPHTHTHTHTHKKKKP